MTNLPPLLPDILGMISDGPRIANGPISYLVGVYPLRAFINQPFEVIVILQNMVDQAVPVQIALQIPDTASDGGLLALKAAMDQVTVTLKPGEVGVMHLPIIARPPTRAATDVPIKVVVRPKVEEQGQWLRLPGRSAQPGKLATSPFIVQALRGIAFLEQPWDEVDHRMIALVDIAAKKNPEKVDFPEPRYDLLWSANEYKADQARLQKVFAIAQRVAKPTAHGTLFHVVLSAIEQRFTQRGIFIYDAETAAIAKLMVYTIEDAAVREQRLSTTSMRWFRALCQNLAANERLEDADRDELLAYTLFDDVLYDAILMGFHVLESHIVDDLGDEQERFDYAANLMNWFNGSGAAELGYIYMPLVLGGVAVGHIVERNWRDNGWVFYDKLMKVYNERIRTAREDSVILFDMLMSLLNVYSKRLKQQGVERPQKPSTMPKPPQGLREELNKRLQEGQAPGIKSLKRDEKPSSEQKPPTQSRIRRIKRD